MTHWQELELLMTSFEGWSDMGVGMFTHDSLYTINSSRFSDYGCTLTRIWASSPDGCDMPMTRARRRMVRSFVGELKKESARRAVVEKYKQKEATHA